ncbi:MAG: hypothetical protein ABI230_00610 [Aestuariivirga sp.]
MRDAMRNHMQTNLSPKAVRILDEIMSDSKVMPKVRVDAAKCLLDRSGYSAGGKFVSETDHQKPIDEMTIEELEAFIRRPSMVIEHEENRRAAEAKLVPGAEDYLS